MATNAQLNLFDQPAPVTAPARRSLPLSSHQAAARASVFVGSHVERIEAALASGESLTGHELSERTGLTNVQILRRCRDMAKAGILIDCGMRKCGGCGHLETSWRARA